MMALTREQARALDRRAIEEFGIPGIVLMENAGRNMAELLRSLGAAGPVAICCGKGNNGGDGLVIARHLANTGVRVRVFLFAESQRLPEDARINAHIVERMAAAEPDWVTLGVFPGAVDEGRLRQGLSGCDWVVDALFGSGLRGAVPPPFDLIIATINTAAAQVFAVDIPSGLDSDTGRPLGPTVRAHHTATVAASKTGFEQPEAAAWVGTVHIIDMGAPRCLLAPPTSADPKPGQG
jgi:NAD(P)H-hydrate epimerase